MSNKIAILGAGAIGSSLGGLLRHAGQDVLLVGRAPQVAAIRAKGLHVDGVLGSFDVQVDATEKLQTPPDLAFLTVKSQDLLTTLAEYKDLLSDAPVVLFQNGVRGDEITASVLPQKERIATRPHQPPMPARIPKARTWNFRQRPSPQGHDQPNWQIVWASHQSRGQAMSIFSQWSNWPGVLTLRRRLTLCPFG